MFGKNYPNSGPKIIARVFWTAVSYGMAFSHFMSSFQDVSSQGRVRKEV